MRPAFVVCLTLLYFAGLCISGKALAAAAPIPQAGTNFPAVRDRIGRVPLAQAFASLEKLGSWQLPSGTRVNMMTFMTKNGGECTDPDSNPSSCPQYGLLVSLFDCSSSLRDPALFRGPDRMGWKMLSDRPKKLSDGNNNTEYSLDLLACEAQPHAANGKTDHDWHGVRYTLDFNVGLLTDTKTGYAHWIYAVNLVRAADDEPRVTCIGTPETP
jgi:hypothetical protein